MQLRHNSFDSVSFQCADSFAEKDYRFSPDLRKFVSTAIDSSRTRYSLFRQCDNYNPL